MDEDAVTVTNDTVAIEEEAVGNGAAIGVTANPGQDAVIVAQLPAAFLGLINTVRAGGIDECFERAELGGQDR